MTYIIIILSVALWGTFWWAVSLREKYKAELKDNEYKKEEIARLIKVVGYQKDDIYELVEGGMIQQEAVQMKYKEMYRKQRELEKMSLAAHRLSARRPSGLSWLGGIGDHLNPLR